MGCLRVNTWTSTKRLARNYSLHSASYTLRNCQQCSTHKQYQASSAPWLTSAITPEGRSIRTIEVNARMVLESFNYCSVRIFFALPSVEIILPLVVLPRDNTPDSKMERRDQYNCVSHCFRCAATVLGSCIHASYKPPYTCCNSQPTK